MHLHPLFVCCAPGFKLLGLFLWQRVGRKIWACTLESDGPFGDFPPPLFQAVVDSVLAVRKPGEPIDLHMVEIMEMKHKSETDTT